MASIPRVVFWDTLPAPYGVEQYNALTDRRSFDLTVWFCRRTEPDRRWDVSEADWRFTGLYVGDPSRGLADLAGFVHRCRTVRPDLIVLPYGERSFVVGHAVIKALGIRAALGVEASFDAWVRRSWWKEIAKSLLFRSADAAHAGPGAVSYARRYGLTADRVFLVRQTTDVAHFARRLSTDERRAYRDRVGVDGCVFLYVGRFWKPKGLLSLLEAFGQARRVDDRITLLLVGDGTDEEEIRRAAAAVGRVVFWPFVQRRDLPAYYALADVFVFPTLGDPHGHVIEEAHAAGLPVITSDAAGDVAHRVEDGVTGFIVPAGDAAALARRMLTLAADADLRRSMGERGAERVKAWGHDTYVSEVERLVNACLALPPRATFAARALSRAGGALVYTADAAGRLFHRQLA